MTTPERVSTYRDRLAEAVLTFHGRIDNPHASDTAIAYGTADAVLAVRDAETEWLRGEVSKARDRLASARQFRESERRFQELNDEIIRLAADKAHVETELTEAKKKIEDLSSRIERAKALHSRFDGEPPECQYDNLAWPCEMWSILDNPPPGDTPDQPDDDLTKGVIDDLTPDEIASFMAAVNDTPEPRSGS